MHLTLKFRLQIILICVLWDGGWLATRIIKCASDSMKVSNDFLLTDLLFDFMQLYVFMANVLSVLNLSIWSLLEFSRLCHDRFPVSSVEARLWACMIPWQLFDETCVLKYFGIAYRLRSTRTINIQKLYIDRMDDSAWGSSAPLQFSQASES